MSATPNNFTFEDGVERLKAQQTQLAAIEFAKLDDRQKILAYLDCQKNLLSQYSSCIEAAELSSEEKKAIQIKIKSLQKLLTDIRNLYSDPNQDIIFENTLQHRLLLAKDISNKLGHLSLDKDHNRDNEQLLLDCKKIASDALESEVNILESKIQSNENLNVFLASDKGYEKHLQKIASLENDLTSQEKSIEEKNELLSLYQRQYNEIEPGHREQKNQREKLEQKIKEDTNAIATLKTGIKKSTDGINNASQKLNSLFDNHKRLSPNAEFFTRLMQSKEEKILSEHLDKFHKKLKKKEAISDNEIQQLKTAFVKYDSADKDRWFFNSSKKRKHALKNIGLEDSSQAYLLAGDNDILKNTQGNIDSHISSTQQIAQKQLAILTNKQSLGEIPVTTEALETLNNKIAAQQAALKKADTARTQLTNQLNKEKSNLKNTVCSIWKNRIQSLKDLLIKPAPLPSATSLPDTMNTNSARLSKTTGTFFGQSCASGGMPQPSGTAPIPGR